MSIEQLLVFIILVGLPLVRALRAALEKRRRPSPELMSETRDTPDAAEEPAFYWPPAPEQRAPEPPPPPPPPRPPVAMPTVYTSIAPAPPREAAVRPPAAPRHAAPRRRMPVVQLDQESLRRAVVLMTVFGPPRAQDR